MKGSIEVRTFRPRRVAFGLEWPMKFGYFHGYYDGPHHNLYLGAFYFYWSAAA